MKYLNRVLAYCGVGIHEAVDDLREYLVVHGDNLQVCDEKFALKMMELGRLVDRSIFSRHNKYSTSPRSHLLQ